MLVGDYASHDSVWGFFDAHHGRTYGLQGQNGVKLTLYRTDIPLPNYGYTMVDSAYGIGNTPIKRWYQPLDAAQDYRWGIQNEMKRLSRYTGAVNGWWDTATIRGIQTCCQKAGLLTAAEVDGIVGVKTVVACLEYAIGYDSSLRSKTYTFDRQGFNEGPGVNGQQFWRAFYLRVKRAADNAWNGGVGQG